VITYVQSQGCIGKRETGGARPLHRRTCGILLDGAIRAGSNPDIGPYGARIGAPAGFYLGTVIELILEDRRLVQATAPRAPHCDMEK